MAPITLLRPTPAQKTASNGDSNSTAARVAAAVVGSHRAIGRRNRQPPCTATAATAQHRSTSNQGTGKASNSTHSKPAETHKQPKKD